jgi:hypothetical protein
LWNITNVTRMQWDIMEYNQQLWVNYTLKEIYRYGHTSFKH